MNFSRKDKSTFEKNKNIEYEELEEKLNQYYNKDIDVPMKFERAIETAFDKKEQLLEHQRSKHGLGKNIKTFLNNLSRGVRKISQTAIVVLCVFGFTYLVFKVSLVLYFF